MIKHLLKITNNVKKMESNTYANIPTDDQMHEGINKQRNNPTNISIKTLLKYSIHHVSIQAHSTLDWMRGLGS
jgi:hypothetical protein